MSEPLQIGSAVMRRSIDIVTGEVAYTRCVIKRAREQHPTDYYGEDEDGSGVFVNPREEGIWWVREAERWQVGGLDE